MGTVIYLNTDQNNTTGYELSFGNVGAEYAVQFTIDTNPADSTYNTLQAYLFSATSAGIAAGLNGGPPALSLPASMAEASNSRSRRRC